MKELRERTGLSPLEIAFHLEKSEATIRFWETGRSQPRLTPQETKRLLEVYKCTLDELADAVSETLAASTTGK